ncbi:hypothetical protein AFCA_009736 [Aspergillus flavus]|nr:hypothetical protein AFCA_009736 [Aspergillus flavus]
MDTCLNRPEKSSNPSNTTTNTTFLSFLPSKLILSKTIPNPHKNPPYESRSSQRVKKKKHKMATYSVYLMAESGLPRDHHAIFVETYENGPSTGHLYHVKGNIQEGMISEHRAEQPPEEIPGFCGKEKLGVVAVAEYGRVLGICEGVPVPQKQFQGAKRLYPREPLRRCQEWVAEAVDALKGEGVLIGSD